MRGLRIKGENGIGYYHVCSRIVNREYLIDVGSRNFMLDFMYRLAEFSGVHILTWTILDNHFHMLIDVPEQPELDTDELLRRHAALYGEISAKKLETAWKKLTDEVLEIEQQNLRKRMGDISHFMKIFKQVFTTRYNNLYDHHGTMWEARYASTLLEGEQELLYIVGAYIDLNPVRAGIVTDPALYQWSGYAQACAGHTKARDGLMRIFESDSWDETQRLYRKTLYLVGDASKDPKGRKGFSPEEIQKVIEENGKLPLSVLLRCRCRCFTTAGVLGSSAFCRKVSHRYHPTRTNGSYALSRFNPVDFPHELYTIRAIRTDEITLPTALRPQTATPPLKEAC